MQRIGLTFGVIAGVLLSAFLFLGMTLIDHGSIDFDKGMILGYTTMLVALTTVFFGVKSYRDKHLNGSIAFGKALLLGLMISGVASVMYAATWEVYCRTNPGGYTKHMDEYQKFELDKLAAGGATPEEVQAKTEEMAGFMKMYENPFVRFGFTLVEVLPVGIVVSLASAAILRRKRVLPA